MENSILKIFGSVDVKITPDFCSYVVNIKKIAPLHIAAKQENLKLCEHILNKTEDNNPKGDMSINWLVHQHLFI